MNAAVYNLIIAVGMAQHMAIGAGCSEQRAMAHLYDAMMKIVAVSKIPKIPWQPGVLEGLPPTTPHPKKD